MSHASSTITVVAGLIQQGGRLLVCQRRRDGAFAFLATSTLVFVPRQLCHNRVAIAFSTPGMTATNRLGAARNGKSEGEPGASG